MWLCVRLTTCGWLPRLSTHLYRESTKIQTAGHTCEPCFLIGSFEVRRPTLSLGHTIWLQRLSMDMEEGSLAFCLLALTLPGKPISPPAEASFVVERTSPESNTDQRPAETASLEDWATSGLSVMTAIGGWAWPPAVSHSNLLLMYVDVFCQFSSSGEYICKTM